ncbi:MSHA biogenesis protein MshI [Shewanella donghaensis]|uniref:MSHA biogenesis protein MshI n=1 Tax=Shewanella donghaensis TaxID=238836 RepID=UPI0011826265|nr:MSHA biogenesis protein MshI [Shewanella donghaensis]
MKNGFLNKLTFWRQNIPVGELGLYVAADSIYVFKSNVGGTAEQRADLATEPQSKFPIEGVSYKIAFDGDNWTEAFTAIFDGHGAAKLQIVLGESFYQLIAADKPNVPAEELKQALLWSVKDLVSEPVSNIQLDYFESSLTASGKINVVVANKQQLSNLAQVSEEKGFVIAGISIEELAMTTIFQDDLSHMIVSHVSGQELLLTVVKQGELLMQRRVRGFTQIDKASAQDLEFGLADNLSLEIQRSMDYFESQLRQAPVGSIDLLIGGEYQALVPLVSQNFNQNVNAIQHDSVSSHFSMMSYSLLAGSLLTGGKA